MRLLLQTIWHGLRPAPLVLKIDFVIYRWARLLCGWLEEMSPEVSQRAGFVYDLGCLRNNCETSSLDEEFWFGDLGDDDITEAL